MPHLEPSKLPECTMTRVILHWTGGSYRASDLDKQHYHVLIEGDGRVVFGRHSIDRNASPHREPRASHTRLCNTGSIGVSVCCMRDARERPFFAGPSPMTLRQWQIAAEVIAELCDRYRIDISPRSVLAHGEVQSILKIEQRQKWDPLILPWSPTTPRDQVMNAFREQVRRHLATM